MPLGEVSVVGVEVMEIGTVLSLVESSGTIVVQGVQGQPPLDEGSVLSSQTKESQVRQGQTIHYTLVS